MFFESMGQVNPPEGVLQGNIAENRRNGKLLYWGFRVLGYCSVWRCTAYMFVKLLGSVGPCLKRQGQEP